MLDEGEGAVVGVVHVAVGIEIGGVGGALLGVVVGGGVGGVEQVGDVRAGLEGRGR